MKKNLTIALDHVDKVIVFIELCAQSPTSPLDADLKSTARVYLDMLAARMYFRSLLAKIVEAKGKE